MEIDLEGKTSLLWNETKAEEEREILSRSDNRF
jgi:hypothetical protein